MTKCQNLVKMIFMQNQHPSQLQSQWHTKLLLSPNQRRMHLVHTAQSQNPLAHHLGGAINPAPAAIATGAIITTAAIAGLCLLAAQ